MTTLITGGTGKTGSRVAHRLNALGRPVRAVTRHSEPRFDWHDHSTWEGALSGCTSAYVTFQPDLALPGADAILGAFSRRAVALGCTRLVLLSGRGEDGARRAEAAFAAAGAQWTILRSAFFFQNFTEAFWAEEIAAGSLTMVESTVGEPFIDADDLADVAVAALLDPGHIGRIHELTGPRLITFRDITDEIATAYGRPVVYRELPVEDYIAALVSMGLPQEDATGLAYVFDQALDGRNAQIESGVNDVLGRDGRDFATFLGDTLAQPAPRMNRIPMVEPMHEPAAPTAADFATALEQLTTGGATPAMRDVFALAKTMTDMPLGEVRLLLASDEHLHRVGAVSVHGLPCPTPPGHGRGASGPL